MSTVREPGATREMAGAPASNDATTFKTAGVLADR